MTHNVVDLAAKRRLTNPGNGSLEAVREYFATEHNWPNHIPAMTEADYFLAWLWVEGFKIVPLFGGHMSSPQDTEQPHD